MAHTMPPQRCRRDATRAAPAIGAGLALVALALPALVGAQPAAAPPRDHDITVEDYFTLSHIWQVAIAPDGANVAWSELRWEDGHPARNADLWTARTRGGAPRRLTFDHALDADPTFSADGATLFYTSTRKSDEAPALAKGLKQVWRVGLDGSGMMAVTRAADGVEGWALSRDNAALFYLTAREQQDKDGFEGLRKAHALDYGRGVRKWSTLWRLDLRSWRLDKVAEVPAFVRAFALAPDQRKVALITVPSRRLIDNEGWSNVEILDLSLSTRPDKPVLVKVADEVWRKQAPSPYGWLEHPAFSDDSKLLAFTVGFDGFPGETIAVELDGVRATAVTRLPRLGEYAMEGPVALRPGSRDVCTMGTLAARDGVFCVAAVQGGKHGAPYRLSDAPSGNVSAFAFSARGKGVAVVQSDLTHVPDVFLYPPQGGKVATRLTSQNPQVERWRLPSIQTVRWKGRDGATVEGILELPPGFEPGKGKLPLVVELHGGPTSATKLELRYWIYGRTLFAARGWALLSPNYRGSTGYGDKFMTDLVAHENDIEVADIRAGVDKLIADGLVDEGRMAVMGWSNGGYLTNCIIAADPRFKAASSGAGVFDSTMQWLIEDTPGHVINYHAGQPWAVPEAMRKSSPLYQVQHIKTPTLIHVGEHDERVPVQHSRGLFRALDQYLGVPTQLVVYPGEGHGLTKRAHREAKLRWDLAWFERHVPGFAKGDAAPPKASGGTPAPVR